MVEWASGASERTFNQSAANRWNEPILLKNSCLIDDRMADSILPTSRRIDDDGIEAGSAGGIVL